MQLVYNAPTVEEMQELRQALDEAHQTIAALRDQIQDLELDLTLCQPRVERPFDRPQTIRLRQRNHMPHPPTDPVS